MKIINLYVELNESCQCIQLNNYQQNHTRQQYNIKIRKLTLAQCCELDCRPYSEFTSFYVYSSVCAYVVYVCARLLSHVRLFMTSRPVACQAPLSMEFSRQEYWIGLPFLIPGDLPNPEIEPPSLASPALAGEFSTTAPLG